jgi:hypothetical protein
MEQMMANLLAEMKAEIRTNREEMKTNQAKMDANLKEMKEEMMARLEAKIEASKRRLRSLEALSSPRWIPTRPKLKLAMRNGWLH